MKKPLATLCIIFSRLIDLNLYWSCWINWFDCERRTGFRAVYFITDISLNIPYPSLCCFLRCFPCLSFISSAFFVPSLSFFLGSLRRFFRFDRSIIHTTILSVVIVTVSPAFVYNIMSNNCVSMELDKYSESRNEERNRWMYTGYWFQNTESIVPYRIISLLCHI